MKTAKELVDDLIESGETEVGISRLVGCAQSTIHRINSGRIKNTSFDIWRKLSQVHEDRIASNDDPKGDEAA